MRPGGKLVRGVSALAVGLAVLQPDGKIILGGTSMADGQPRMTITRRNPDGSLDLTFGDPE